jgi:ATP-dependent RNA helicase DDX46/PRP5
MDPDEDEEYRLQFLAEFRKQKQIEKGKEKMIFNGDDDDDKYIMEIEKDEDDAESFLEKEKRKAEKKDLKRVDHSLENYEPINKSLYIETKEITKMTDKEVSEFKKLNGDIKVRGLKCPRPISNWY